MKIPKTIAEFQKARQEAFLEGIRSWSGWGDYVGEAKAMAEREYPVPVVVCLCGHFEADHKERKGYCFECKCHLFVEDQTQ